MTVRATSAQIATAWRAFRGDRKGALLGPGPGFAEAIGAALGLDPLAERVVALEAEVEQLRCPLGMDAANAESRSYCSAGTCLGCQGDHGRWWREEAGRLEAEVARLRREAEAAPP